MLALFSLFIIEMVIILMNLIIGLAISNIQAGNAHSLIFVRGRITVPSTGLDMTVVDINKNFLYNPVRPAFWEVDGT